MHSLRIEKKVTLNAPVSRVWRAITDAREFGQWFGLELHGQFVQGMPITGSFHQEFSEAAIHGAQERLGLTPSRVRTPEKVFTFCTVERIEPEHYFSFRWIPYGIDADVDPNDEPTTLVEFHLEPIAEGTLLRIVESGFERVPAQRRQRAFLMDEAGWSAQTESIKRHVENA